MSRVEVMNATGQPPKMGNRGTLKRYLSFGNKGKAKDIFTPPPSQPSSTVSSRLPSSNSSCVSVPRTSSGSLEDRYGKPGRMLGDGATANVQVFTNPSDGHVVAVKRFQPKSPLQDEKTYAKKITEEFTIGSPLKHGNIINTLEIVKEGGNWFQVMEYAPIELFEVSETRMMSSEEINCAWTQILEGVNYLHRMGIAHRDLKLENVVMTDDGIMKIIDFGCATCFRPPSSSGNVVLARGYVGCEPYMAPEIFNGQPYDPRAIDVWCMAIIYCYLNLGRFPWEKAKDTDHAFRCFSKQSSTNLCSEKYAQNTVTGAATLLNDLPSESRLTIKGMLQLTPSRRLNIRQVLQHPWIKKLSVCSQDSEGKIHRAKNHTHTLASDDLSQETSRAGSDAATD